MRIVVTGGAGFIASVLTVRAAEQGHEVLALDDLSRGLNHLSLFEAAPNVSAWVRDNPWPAPITDRIVGVKHDCRGGFGEALKGLAEAGRLRDAPMSIDAVVHLAAGTGSLDRPYEELVGLNVEMTKRVWQDAKDLGARVFVFPTTSLGTVPALAESPYVRSKEDAMTWLLGQTDGPALVPLRFFNVAGAYRGRTERRKHEVHLIPKLVQCYAADEPLVINGGDYETSDGTPSREFTHVLDVVDAILVLIAPTGRRLTQDGALMADGTVWIGTGWPTTVLEASAIFSQWVGSLQVKLGPRRAFDCGVLHCHPSASGYIERMLGRSLAPAWVSIRDEVLELLKGG